MRETFPPLPSVGRLLNPHGPSRASSVRAVSRPKSLRRTERRLTTDHPRSVLSTSTIDISRGNFGKRHLLPYPSPPVRRSRSSRTNNTHRVITSGNSKLTLRFRRYPSSSLKTAGIISAVRLPISARRCYCDYFRSRATPRRSSSPRFRNEASRVTEAPRDAESSARSFFLSSSFSPFFSSSSSSSSS